MNDGSPEHPGAERGVETDGLDAAALERHGHVHFYFDVFERSLEGARDGAIDRDRLTAEIRTLAGRLDDHNRAEIEGGLLQQVLDRLPDRENRILVLTEQNDALAARLDALAVRLRHGALEDVLGALFDWVRDARDHEREEERLIERALSEPHPSS